jgi:hypothetical protein
MILAEHEGEQCDTISVELILQRTLIRDLRVECLGHPRAFGADHFLEQRLLVAEPAIDGDLRYSGSLRNLLDRRGVEATGEKGIARRIDDRRIFDGIARAACAARLFARTGRMQRSVQRSYALGKAPSFGSK